MQSKTLEETIAKAERQVIINETFENGFKKQLIEVFEVEGLTDYGIDQMQKLCGEIKELRALIKKDKAYLGFLQTIQKEIK